MGCYVVDHVVRMLTQCRIHVVDANVLVMGLTFKENCPDIRNTRVMDIVEALKGLNANVDVYDPWVDKTDVQADMVSIRWICRKKINTTLSFSQFLTENLSRWVQQRFDRSASLNMSCTM